MASRSGTYRCIRRPVGLVPKPVTSTSEAADAGPAGITTAAAIATTAAAAASKAFQDFFMSESSVIRGGAAAGHRTGRPRGRTSHRAVQVGVADGPTPVPWKPNSVKPPAETLPL